MQSTECPVLAHDHPDGRARQGTSGPRDCSDNMQSGSVAFFGPSTRTTMTFEASSPWSVQQVLHPTRDTGSLSASRQDVASSQTDMFTACVK